MKPSRFAFLILLTLISISCRNNNKESVLENTESEQDQSGTSQETETHYSEEQGEEIIQKLQGEWKEQEYPFRGAHFKNNTVKFIEEGLADKITFKEYSISPGCPFETNNVRNLGPEDNVLVMVADRSCEIVRVTTDSLTLSGFNVATNSDYNIVYNRVK